MKYALGEKPFFFRVVSCKLPCTNITSHLIVYGHSTGYVNIMLHSPFFTTHHKCFILLSDSITTTWIHKWCTFLMPAQPHSSVIIFHTVMSHVDHKVSSAEMPTSYGTILCDICITVGQYFIFIVLSTNTSYFSAISRNANIRLATQK